MRLPWKRRPPAAAPSENGTSPVAPVAPSAAPGSFVPSAAPEAAPSGTVATPSVAPVAPVSAAVPAPVPAPAVATPATPAPPRPTPAAAIAQAAASVALQPLAPGGTQPGAPGPSDGTPEKPRKRRGLIPSWVPWAAGGAGVLIVVILVVILLVSRSDIVRVPALQGLDAKAAATRLQELGLKFVVGDQRFSANAPVGTIIDQRPIPGAQVAAGTTVMVALSAGSESFAMPDVLGQTIDNARKKLRDRGLNVEFQTAPSDKDQGVVIASVPSPGQTIQTGATVRLTVAAGTSQSDTLLPSNLKNKTFVLDPAPVTGSTADVTMDVARRVRALLEASGATVVVTRAVTDTGDAANTLARSKRAKETSSVALVGFSTTDSGASGLAVVSLPNTSTTQPIYLKSLALTQALTDALKGSFSQVSQATASNDTILSDTGVPAVRLRLGSTQSSADTLTFTDPDWADNVAKAVYRALAQVYGGAGN
jgi:N-acetylmuramoyl-L-alanine amidase